jgi:hypothetical protein
MKLVPALVCLALAALASTAAATYAPAAAPAVKSIRLVGEGGFYYHHTEVVVDRRNPAALARTAAFVPVPFPRLPRSETTCNDCILFTLTIVRGRRSVRLSWYNSAPKSLARLLGALARNGRLS